MNENEIIKKIDYLYSKYKVDKKIYSNMTDKELILGMKGILAELDIKKTGQYDKSDLEIIKKIYSICC